MKPETSDSLEKTKSGYSATNGRNVVYSETSDASEVSDVLVLQRTTEISHGPLPPPRILKEYDNIVKDGAERIMRMAEKEQEARLEEKRLNGESNRRLMERKIDYFKRGQWMALVVAVIMIGMTILFAFSDFMTLAIITLSSSLVGVTALFVYSNSQQKKD